MLGTMLDELETRIFRVNAPLCLSGWMPIQIDQKRRRWPFGQFHLLGEVELDGELTVRATEPVLFTDGRYVVTTGGDDYLLELPNRAWTPPKKFNADEPFGTRFHGPLRFGPWQARFMQWHRHSQMVRGLNPPIRLVDWTATDSPQGIVITGFVFGRSDYDPKTRIKVRPVLTQGRFVKGDDKREYILYDPSLDFRKYKRGHDPLNPFAGM